MTEPEVVPYQAHLECGGYKDCSKEVHYYCFECKLSLCDTCKLLNLHTTHTLKSWCDPDAINARQNGSICCQIHEYKAYTAFCLTCQILCCERCLENHSRHVCSSIDAVYNEMHSKMSGQLTVLQKIYQPKTEKMLEDVNHMVQRCENIYEQNSKSIKSRIKSLKNYLENMEKELLKRNEESKSKCLARVNQKLLASKVRQTGINNAIKDLERNLDNTNKEVFISETKHILDVERLKPPTFTMDLHEYHAFEASKFAIPNVAVYVGNLYLQKQDFPELIPLTADAQQISPEDVELTKMMYDGEFSKCWHGKLKHSRNVTVWLKKKESLNLKAVENQINILTECKHENVLALMASFFKDGHLYFVTESMSKGTLTLFLQGKEGSLLQFSQLIRIACKIAKGMSFLEEKRIVHGELSARNILVGDDIDVKIGEFHLAKREEDDGVLKDRRYRMKWTAPEVFREKRFTIKSDVWSYGILLVEIITYGQTPYPGLLSKEILGKVEEGFRHPKPKDCPDTLYSIMTKCWKKSPEERPTFEFLSDCFDHYEIYFENPYGYT